MEMNIGFILVFAASLILVCLTFTSANGTTTEEDPERYFWKTLFPHNASDGEEIPEMRNPRVMIKLYRHTNLWDRGDRTELKFQVNESLKFKEAPDSLVILVHGFLSDSQSVFPQNVLQEYLEYIKENRLSMEIVVVDYGNIANPGGAGFIGEIKSLLLYSTVAKMTREVGRQLAWFVDWFQVIGYIHNMDKVHVIGFSLGAHVAGILGHYTQHWNKLKLGRITGLDPAGPDFEFTLEMEHKLSPDDATFVDVLHTNAEQLGSAGRLGHADVFANGGRKQPYCQDDILVTIVDHFIGTCSHSMAHKYYAWSINIWITACNHSSWESFKADEGPCPYRVFLGEDMARWAKGSYYYWP